MKRRTFILGGSAALIAGGGAYTWHRLMLRNGDMHNMAGIPNMPGMSDQPRRILALPEGRPLPELPVLKNQSDKAGQFAGTLSIGVSRKEFVAGKSTELFTYNGSSPGPLIDVREGDSVSVAVTNQLKDRETTVHWHGLDIPSDQDGNPMNPIKPRSKKTFAFDLAADNTGAFWYHPHPHADTPEQVYMGLAAPFIVRPKDDPLRDLAETTLFITSLSLLEDGKIAPNTMADLMNGREGDHVLINGEKNPVLQVAPGSSRKFRFFNATNGRYLRLTFDDPAMTLVGTDGGYLSSPVDGVKELLLAPAERAEVVVTFSGSAGRTVLRNLMYDRGWMGNDKPATSDMTLMTIDRIGPEEQPFTLPRKLRAIEPLGPHSASKRLEFGERMAGMSMEFLINGKTFDMKRVDLASRVGDVELWEVVNPTDMDHPLHIHGAQFQVIERERSGKRNNEPFLSWKDTVNVARGETVRLKITHRLKGVRMYHCHVLEHEKLGMMGVLDVS